LLGGVFRGRGDRVVNHSGPVKPANAVLEPSIKSCCADQPRRAAPLHRGQRCPGYEPRAVLKPALACGGMRSGSDHAQANASRKDSWGRSPYRLRQKLRGSVNLLTRARQPLIGSTSSSIDELTSATPSDRSCIFCYAVRLSPRRSVPRRPTDSELAPSHSLHGAKVIVNVSHRRRKTRIVGKKESTLFRRPGCEKVALAGQFEAGGRVPVTCPA
jgi:hypothetical protein